MWSILNNTAIYEVASQQKQFLTYTTFTGILKGICDPAWVQEKVEIVKLYTKMSKKIQDN